MHFMPTKDGHANPEIEGHYYYGNYYAVQAMFLAGGGLVGKLVPGGTR